MPAICVRDAIVDGITTSYLPGSVASAAKKTAFSFRAAKSVLRVMASNKPAREGFAPRAI